MGTQMIKDWNTFRDMALDLTKKGFIPVYGEFCPELDEVITECIFIAQKHGMKEVTLLINSNGGQSDCFTSIRAAMFQSGISFTGLVMARARSNGFRILQVCKTRKALANSEIMFHWGQYRLENSEIAAIMEGHTWVLEHVRRTRSTILSEVSARTGISIVDLQQYALFERNFTAEEALGVGFIDDVVVDPPVPSKLLENQLESRNDESS